MFSCASPSTPPHRRVHSCICISRPRARVAICARLVYSAHVAPEGRLPRCPFSLPLLAPSPLSPLLPCLPIINFLPLCLALSPSHSLLCIFPPLPPVIFSLASDHTHLEPTQPRALLRNTWKPSETAPSIPPVPPHVIALALSLSSYFTPLVVFLPCTAFPPDLHPVTFVVSRVDRSVLHDSTPHVAESRRTPRTPEDVTTERLALKERPPETAFSQ